MLAWCVLALPASSREVQILVVGGAALESCRELHNSNEPRVFRVQRGSALDSVRGRSCVSACAVEGVWSALGEQMIERHNADAILFFVIGTPNTRAQDLLPRGSQSAGLMMTLDIANAQKVTFDYALWHGAQVASKADVTSLSRLMRAISLSVPVRKWLVARGAGGPVRAGEAMAVHQKALINPILNRYSGPDLTGVEHPADACGVTRERFARLWSGAIDAAEMWGLRYQKESLLYYFR